MWQPYDHSLRGVSQKLRKQMTDAERLLWSRLRGKQVLGLQFYRQKPIGPYVADFFCPGLVIEIDGSQHRTAEHLESDAARDSFLTGLGLTVLRFDNRQVLLETEAVLERIFEICRERRIPPVPPFSTGGT
ncbi:hypothetical protein GMST_12760 [Geomonas silvestris]|uniref:DUF559 domain-containing protein n=1 Tax=Geomonas silvestris TaxID=2740184 RepID=A0A6V8MG23_9BACT|nr:DUF559 domain-containing protein [Geomonas silvestris]GFO58951.1 hypothetical protein GMST_12760 [Geomonas silvestris]